MYKKCNSLPWRTTAREECFFFTKRKFSSLYNFRKVQALLKLPWKSVLKSVLLSDD